MLKDLIQVEENKDEIKASLCLQCSAKLEMQAEEVYFDIKEEIKNILIQTLVETLKEHFFENFQKIEYNMDDKFENGTVSSFYFDFQIEKVKDGFKIYPIFKPFYIDKGSFNAKSLEEVKEIINEINNKVIYYLKGYIK